MGLCTTSVDMGVGVGVVVSIKGAKVGVGSGIAPVETSTFVPSDVKARIGASIMRQNDSKKRTMALIRRPIFCTYFDLVNFVCRFFAIAGIDVSQKTIVRTRF